MEWKSFTIRNDARFLIIYIRALLADDQNNDNMIEDAQDKLEGYMAQGDFPISRQAPFGKTGISLQQQVHKQGGDESALEQIQIFYH